eukprot:UN00854
MQCTPPRMSRISRFEIGGGEHLARALHGGSRVRYPLRRSKNGKSEEEGIVVSIGPPKNVMEN